MDALIARAATFQRAFESNRTYLAEPSERRATLILLFDNYDRLYKTQYTSIFLSSVPSNSCFLYWNSPVKAQWIVQALAEKMASMNVAGDVEIAPGWVLGEIDQKILVNYVLLSVKTSPLWETLYHDIPREKPALTRRK